uniref:Lamina-associated polypeptide 2, isoforms beta/gamma-like n=1 Tax=Gouania willdenowi TaxID=441366 RepID=A0A8C5FZ50_GOUWI
MPFVEDPARFSKSRLKSDLVAHNVALPPAASKKDVYVELHLKHIERNQTADFSSDEEEEQERNVAEDEKLPDPRSLTDDELRGALLRYGVKAGPIVASTRSVYENKLRKLLQPDGRVELNGADDAVLYSDSEEDIQEHGVQDDEESGSEEELLIVELTKNAHQKSKQYLQAELFYQSGEYSYPQCFLPSTRLCVHPSRNTKSAPSRNSRTAKKPSEERSSHCSQIPRDISRAASVDQCSGLGLGTLRSESLKTKVCLSRSTQTFSITQLVKEGSEIIYFYLFL